MEKSASMQATEPVLSSSTGQILPDGTKRPLGIICQMAQNVQRTTIEIEKENLGDKRANHQAMTTSALDVSASIMRINRLPMMQLVVADEFGFVAMAVVQ